MSESLRSFGRTNEKLQIGGFIAIGRDPRNGADAYVADEKDAQLFTAAPELLEVLKDTLSALKQFDEKLESYGPRSVLMMRVRQVIAKATGSTDTDGG